MALQFLWVPLFSTRLMKTLNPCGHTQMVNFQDPIQDESIASPTPNFSHCADLTPHQPSSQGLNGMQTDRTENQGTQCTRNKPGQGAREPKSLPSLRIPTGDSHCGSVSPAQSVPLRLGLRVPRGCPKKASCPGFLLACPPWSPIFIPFLPIDIVVTPKHSGRNKDSRSAQAQRDLKFKLIKLSLSLLL